AIGRTESSAEDAAELLVRLDREDRDAVPIEGSAAERDGGAPAVGTHLDDASVSHGAGELVEHLRFLERDHALRAVEAFAQPQGACQGPCRRAAAGALNLPSPPREYPVEPSSHSSFPPPPVWRGEVTTQAGGSP